MECSHFREGVQPVFLIKLFTDGVDQVSSGIVDNSRAASQKQSVRRDSPEGRIHPPSAHFTQQGDEDEIARLRPAVVGMEN